MQVYFYLIFKQEISKIIAPGFLRFVSIFYLIFKKEINKIIALGFLRFVSILLFDI